MSLAASATWMEPVPWMTMAFSFLLPKIAPAPQPAAWHMLLTMMESGTRFSPAGPMAHTQNSGPASLLSREVVSRVPLPHRSEASSKVTSSLRILTHTGVSDLPSTMMAS